ncbi:hypothetical protein [Cellulomonas sp. Marseille-Q8402]
MLRNRRALTRLLAVGFATLTLGGAVASTTAASADAATVSTGSVPDAHGVVPGPSASAGALTAGLYVQVVDGRIVVTHPGVPAGFAAGQFGFLPTTMLPPLVVPRVPGVVFTPPPTFQPPRDTQQQQAADEVAGELARQQALAQTAADQAAADAAAADQARAAATRAQQTFFDLLVAEQRAAIASMDAARTRDEAEGAVNQAMSALAEATSDEERAAAQVALDLARTAYAAAQAAAEDAATEASLVTIQVQDAVVARDAAELAATEAQDRAAAGATSATAAIATARTATQGYSPVLPSTPPAATEPVTAQPATVAPGQALALAAAGFAPGTAVTFGIYSEPLAVAPVTADAGGYAVASFQVPASFTGSHTLVALGTGLDGLLRVLRLDVEVAAPAVAAPAAVAAAATAATPAAVAGPRLADSGVSPGTGAATAGGLLLLGGAPVGMARRRRAAPADA